MAATSQAPQRVDITTTEPHNVPPVARKPHTMTATWHKADPSTWTFFQRLLIRLDILQQGANTPAPPVHAKSDKVPHYPVYRQWMWILPRAVTSIAIHRLFMEVTGWTFHPVFAFL